jgi:hypothetical protein
MEMGWRGYQNRSYEGVSFEIERAAVAAQDLLGEGTAGTLWNIRHRLRVAHKPGSEPGDVNISAYSAATIPSAAFFWQVPCSNKQAYIGPRKAYREIV